MTLSFERLINLLLFCYSCVSQSDGCEDGDIGKSGAARGVRGSSIFKQCY